MHGVNGLSEALGTGVVPEIPLKNSCRSPSRVGHACWPYRSYLCMYKSGILVVARLDWQALVWSLQAFYGRILAGHLLGSHHMHSSGVMY